MRRSRCCPIGSPRRQSRSLRHTRSGAFELVGEDSAAGRDCALRRRDESLDAPAVERREPTGLYQIPLAIDEELVEHCERGPVRRRFHCAHLHRAKLEEWREPRLAFLRRTAPSRNDHDHGSSVRAAREPDLRRQLFRAGPADLGAALEDRLGLGERVNEHARADAR